MGGFGSGSWQRGKPLTTQRKRLDIRDLQREALGLKYAYQRWRDGASASISFVDDIVASVETRFPGQATHRSSVELDRTRLNYGWHRVWWRCPCCHVRVAVLYWEGWRWQCRKCAGLVHESTRQAEDSLAYARVNKIREKLGWGGGLCSPMGGRPKGMHWTTYARLMQQLTEASIQAAGACADRTDTLVSRLMKSMKTR
jgi:hypothetical protein